MLSHIMSQILIFEAVEKSFSFWPFVLASNATVYNNLSTQNCILPLFLLYPINTITGHQLKITTFVVCKYVE